MGLIKSQDAPPTMASFSMQDIETQARVILLRARGRADELLLAAQTEAEQLRKTAYAQGLAQGRREGEAQGQRDGAATAKQEALAQHSQEFKTLLAAMASASTALDEHRSALEVAALEEVVQLSIAIARRVTHRQGLVDPGVLAGNVAEALKLVVHMADIRITLHPSQEALLQEMLPQLRIDWPRLGHVSIVKDESIAPGGCRVYAGHGQIDAELATQLDRIVDELLPTPAPAVEQPVS